MPPGIPCPLRPVTEHSFHLTTYIANCTVVIKAPTGIDKLTEFGVYSPLYRYVADGGDIKEFKDPTWSVLMPRVESQPIGWIHGRSFEYGGR